MEKKGHTQEPSPNMRVPIGALLAVCALVLVLAWVGWSLYHTGVSSEFFTWVVIGLIIGLALIPAQ